MIKVPKNEKQQKEDHAVIFFIPASQPANRLQPPRKVNHARATNWFLHGVCWLHLQEAQAANTTSPQFRSSLFRPSPLLPEATAFYHLVFSSSHVHANKQQSRFPAQ